MTPKVTPMIHVPDVQSTIDWYQGIGFTVNRTYGSDGKGLSFAILSFGTTQVMFNQGGRPSSERRREVDLYTYTDDVDTLYTKLKDRVDVVEGLHDTFYGMREFIIRDPNRFWITFGQDSSFGTLMNAVYEGNLTLVQKALDRGDLTPEALTSALVAGTSDDAQNEAIAALLLSAGAVLPPKVEGRVLESHVGHYKSEEGMEVDIEVKDSRLVASPASQAPQALVAIDDMTFRPSAFDGVTLTFQTEEGKTVGFQFKQGPVAIQLNRINVR